MKIAITCNIRSDESEKFMEWDEYETIEAIEKGYINLGHTVQIIDCYKSDIENEIKKFKPDIVFNIAEGLSGEKRESIVPELLDKLNVPYTGSGPKTLINALNKAKTHKLLDKFNVPNPRYYESKKPLKKLPENFLYPVIIKPLFEGSSKGIWDKSVVHNDKDLFTVSESLISKFNEQPIIIEEFLTGREFTVAVIGNEDLTILPVVEINFSELPKTANPIYSFEAKWIWDTKEKPLDIFTCPAKLNAELKHEIETVIKNAFKALSCRDWARIDLRLNSLGKVNVLELNPLPGIIPDPKANSCFPKAARAAGYNYEKMLDLILKTSLQNKYNTEKMKKKAKKNN
ncbi:MAG: hypothetical protein ACD_79C00737G0002 [uncultured bacterium]|nr:MAG: hypothetical protein ACD_79C00737G0002 [uncultured bacterium]